MRPARLAALFLACVPAAASAQAGPQPTGTWLTPAGDSQIRISRCGAAYCGTIAKVLAGETRDVHNPDAGLRGRSLVGVALTRDMRPAGEGWEGSLYNFRDGRTYSGKLAMKGPNVLELSGCVLGGLICKKQMWTRVE
ncbi:hypothetical protein CS379_30280 [Methylobacterium frigidaeris]|uniref:DUF2147 domain-containing protein n=1 Tax=Methylobacterium frigidaeris TaxID=2038277 RepID=A0AA37M2V5_9HYPH|nr:DUF2147 domain-containing protein [Methylobacterium frigidaeris]PIK69350.1 hypothetical protein CS379_30280 [Methylobacterium frigidaeris]GJD60009.1 hypothetical protein MPEAHAMD_0140 [Methylobacterium frigidaeris]